MQLKARFPIFFHSFVLTIEISLSLFYSVFDKVYLIFLGNEDDFRKSFTNVR